jgi:lipoprotein-anchoring transpeptidase ErfK/SrfK
VRLRIGAVALATAAALLIGAATAPAHADAATVRVFFLQGEKFSAVDRDEPAGPTIVSDTIAALLHGPNRRETKAGYGTSIPDGATLESGTVNSARRRVELHFDARFAADPDDPAGQDDLSLYGARLAQVVYTATALTGLKQVNVAVAGRRTLKLTRDDFDPTRFSEPATPKPVGPAPTDVRSVQAALVRLTYLPPDAATGAFDYRTQQAILAFQSWEGLGRDGVVGPQTAARLATASPPVPLGRGGGKRVEIHRAKGVVLLIDAGKVVRAIHTSTGQGGDDPDLGTPPGSFTIYRKEQRSWSVPFSTWLPYAAYWDRGWALHGYPDVPSAPASHGCARLPLPEAPVVFAFVSIGTPVRVF